MSEPTQEQIKEFWEWCGFKPSYIGYYPPIDLNNLFEYAVPKMWILNIELLDGVLWSVVASCPDVHGTGKHGDGKCVDENLTLALFWAIWEVIKSGNDFTDSPNGKEADCG